MKAFWGLDGRGGGSWVLSGKHGCEKEIVSVVAAFCIRGKIYIQIPRKKRICGRGQLFNGNLWGIFQSPSLPPHTVSSGFTRSQTLMELSNNPDHEKCSALALQFQQLEVYRNLDSGLLWLKMNEQLVRKPPCVCFSSLVSSWLTASQQYPV